MCMLLMTNNKDWNITIIGFITTNYTKKADVFPFKKI